MNVSQKLSWVSGKLGLIPAFGDSIGKELNKAELGLAKRMVEAVALRHMANVAALEDARSAMSTVFHHTENLTAEMKDVLTIAIVIVESAQAASLKDC